jgi:hypothetical protein
MMADRWEILKGRGSSTNCCICGKKLKDKKVYIGKHPETEEVLFRDSSCGPGSDNWTALFTENKVKKPRPYGW